MLHFFLHLVTYDGVVLTCQCCEGSFGLCKGMYLFVEFAH